jgi:hypothetical protein
MTAFKNTARLPLGVAVTVSGTAVVVIRACKSMLCVCATATTLVTASVVFGFVALVLLESADRATSHTGFLKPCQQFCRRSPQLGCALRRSANLNATGEHPGTRVRPKLCKAAMTVAVGPELNTALNAPHSPMSSYMVAAPGTSAFLMTLL